MSITRKLNRANAAIYGFEIHNGFIGEETLLHFVQDNSFQKIFEKYCNDKMRGYRDFYREFESKTQKYLSKTAHHDKAQNLYDQWFKKTINYFGYSDFKYDTIDLEENGKSYVLVPEEDSHTVAIFLCNDIKCPKTAFERGVSLTNIEGDTLLDDKVSQSWTLSEQVEKSMKRAGISEAILFLPSSAYFFRSDSQLSEQCLEINFDYLMKADQDQALVLATHILNESFFSYSTELSLVEEAESEDESEESEEEAAPSDVKLTLSSNLFKEDLELARQITEELHKQVTLALEILANERLTIDPELVKTSKKIKSNEKVSRQLFENGLFVLYRVLFVLYAEAKKFLPVENPQYASFYSIDHLLEWSSNYLKNEKKGVANPDGTYLWGALKALFTLLRRGVELKGKELVSPYNGQLFSPEQAKMYDEGPLLRDAAIARVLISLSKVGGDESGRKWNFENLGIEQLGAVYEAMLTQKPMVLLENHEWVPAHGGGVGLVSTSFADAMDLDRLEKDISSAKSKRRSNNKKGKKKNDLESYISFNRPGFRPTKGTFVLSTMGGKRRQTASFYTPPKLAQFLVKRTLRPLVENKSVKDILDVRLIEPAVGSGGFLIASVRYMADELLKAKLRENSLDIRGKDKIEFIDLQRCKRQICEKCLYGVDINPLSVELTRTSLYLECLMEGEPLPFLHHHLKSGNSLLWAEFQEMAKTSWSKDKNVEFPTLFDIPVGHLKIDTKILTAWDDMREAHDLPKNSDELNSIFKNKIASLKTERKSIGEKEWSEFAKKMQKKVYTLLDHVKDSQLDFEQIQNNPNIVDKLDERHKDKLSMIPDMDSVLIESYEIDVDPSLERKRKRALINEYGIKQYEILVKNQRAYMRLKALGDLNTALWFWPLDKYSQFPSYRIYKEICNWLLDFSTLDRKKKGINLTKQAFSILKITGRTSRNYGFFHWQVEFSHIFNKGKGFSSLVSNPPWKVVGVKDKVVFPQFDPQFMKTQKDGKNDRLKKLYDIIPDSADSWYSEFLFLSSFSGFWSKGGLGTINPTGQLDLCVLFTLLSEKLLTSSGRNGLLVNKTTIFANKATKNLREHLFDKWGLEIGCSFVNTLNIFDIDSRMEFSVIVGEKGQSDNSRRFINGVTDPNDLQKIDYNLNIKNIKTDIYNPVSITLEEIRLYFSKNNLSIPTLTSEKQKELAIALHRSRGDVSSILELDSVRLLKGGIHVKSGPKKKLSQYSSKINPSELPDTLLVVKEQSNNKKWIPLFKGKHFNFLQPILPELNNSQFYFDQYLHFSKKPNDIDLSKRTLAWKAVSKSDNSRTLVVSILPRGAWMDHSSWGIQFNSEKEMIKIMLLWTSVASDFLVRMIGGMNVTKEHVATLPLPLYDSKSLNEAYRIYQQSKITSKNLKNIQAKIDALIWIHFGMGEKPLDRNGLEWLFNNQFPLIKKNDPDYIQMVLSEYDKYYSDHNFVGILSTSAFKTKNEVIKLIGGS